MQDLDETCNKGVIDMNFTHDPLFINYTPKEQICRQIISKYSTKCKKDTSRYINYYKAVEKALKKIKKSCKE